MLKNRKNKRQLALLVAFALSAGGTLFSDLKHISAADVTGGDVTDADALSESPCGRIYTDIRDRGCL